MISDKHPLHKEGASSSFAYIDKFKQKNLKFTACNFLKRDDFHRIRGKIAFPLVALLLAVLSINIACAALSATTSKTIKGTEPYFTLNGVPLTNTSELLGFTYTDASGTTSAKATADAAVDGTIIIVDPNMKMSDIKAIVPINNKSTALSSLLGGDLNIIDADDDTTGGINAIGTMKAYWTKDTVEGYSPANNETFDACSSYKLTIAITDATSGVIASAQGNIEALTTYGDPDKQQYAYPVTAGTIPVPIYAATYIIEPKVVTPYTCWAKPNLKMGTGLYQDTAYTDWDPKKGFLGSPTMSSGKTFPTTGFYGAWFNLSVAGTTASNIIHAMTSSPSIVGGKLTGYTPFQNGVKLKLEESASNIVTITLYGPRDGDVTAQNEASAPTAAFTPTTWTIRDATARNVYTFTLEKWFITNNKTIKYSTGSSNVWSASNPYGFDGNLETPNYCKNLGGIGSDYYHIASRRDLTNSPQASTVAWNGTPGTGYTTDVRNYMFRAVEGGIAGEWGWLTDYLESEFIEWANYWTSEPATSEYQYIWHNQGGSLSASRLTLNLRAICVSK